MADYHAPMQLRASSSGFAWGSLIFTDYKTACLRKILIQSKGVQSPLDQKYAELGAINEDRHAGRSSGGFVRERAFNIDVAHGVTLSGHADFVHADSVDELKSVQSKNTRRKVIRNGEYLTENLAQLCAYMSAFQKSSGRLIYTYYEKFNDAWQPLEERIFEVAIDDFGRILVDSKPTKFTIYDLYAHQHQAAECVANNRVAQRPNGWEAPFVSPCAFCPFKSACDAYDQGTIESTDAFVTLAHQGMEKKNDPSD